MQYTNGANVNHKERKFKNNKFYCQGNHFVQEVISTSRAKINLIGFFLPGIYGLACKCDKYCSYGLVKCYNRDFLSFYMNQNIITRKLTSNIHFQRVFLGSEQIPPSWIFHHSYCPHLKYHP